MKTFSREDFRIKNTPNGFVVEEKTILSKWYWLLLKFNLIEWYPHKSLNKNFTSIHNAFKIHYFENFDDALDQIDKTINSKNNPFKEEIYYPTKKSLT